MEEQKRATHSQLKALLDSGFLEQSKYEELIVQMGHSSGPLTPWNALEQIIVCFFADGSEKYTQMTIMAISSFLDKTPQIKVGILTHDEEVRDMVFSKLNPIHHGRLLWHKTSETPYFPGWNPTQYKLDIAKFADDGFECIFWMDSDTVTFGDMTQFLLPFVESNKQFLFVKDHVMFNSEFMSNWSRERPVGLVPQACFMGFKYSIVRPFFALWKQVWERWITPHPFANYPDPNPNFIGSMFCIEQYALAMALAQFLGDHNLGEDAVMLFERELILLQHDGKLSFDLVSKIPSSLSGGFSISGLSGLYLSGVSLSGLGYNISGLKVGPSGLNVSGLTRLMSGLNISGLTSGINISGLYSGISGLNVSGPSGLNILAYLLASGASGLNLSGLGISGINLSGLSTEELFSRLSMSGINLSGLNLSGLTVSELERLLAGASVNLSGIDYKYLQGTPGDISSPFQSNMTLVDKFGNSFIHYYHQNFEPLKEGTLQGGSFPAYFAQQKEGKF